MSNHKPFFVEYRLHFGHGETADGDMHLCWWDGTQEGMKKLKKAIASYRQFPRQIEYVEIKAMFECFGESAE